MRLVKLSLALAAGLLCAGPGAAQQPPPFGGFGGGFGGGLTGMLGNSKQLQDELKMDKDQVDKLTAALGKVREEMRDELGKLFQPGTSQDDRAAIGKKIGEANAKAVEGVLKPEQLKRLHQIENQQAGVGMYSKEDVQKALKLDDAQKDKIKEIAAEYQKDLRELNGGGRGGRGGFGGFGGFDPETVRKRESLQKEATGSIQKVLSAEQKTLAKDLTGEPFELRFQGFGIGIGGGGGFGGFSTPGQILSTGAQDRLKLNDEQKKQLEELQKEIDVRLGKILNEEQRKQLKDMQQPPGRGGRGGAPGGQP
jgi:Spy/CpxP family protein refolding chaperone